MNIARKLIVWIALLSCMCGQGAMAQSDTYPNRPIRLIVPFPPGGGTDIISRLVARKMTEGLGQQVIVDNRGGAGGTIGVETVMRASPDGYTIVMVSGTYTVNPALYRSRYHAVDDVSPISLIAMGPSVVTVNPGLPIRTIKDVIAYAIANPGKLNYGSSGQGGSTHLSTELFKLMAHVDMVHIPYKGNGPAVTDLIAGQIQIMFGSVLSVLPHIRSGKLRSIAVTGSKRSSAVPDLPTISESGVPGYEAITWYGLLAPPKLPKYLVLRLNNEIKRILSLPDMIERLSSEGLEPAHTTPEAVAERIKSDVAKWARVVKAANVKLE